MMSIINGTHVLIYSHDAQADRAFFRDVLGFPFLDVGEGWLIFATPPAELAVHPAEGTPQQNHAGHRMAGAVVYFMCDDVRAAIQWFKEKKIECTEVEEEAWGIRTTIKLPSGGEIGLYQPKHQTAIERTGAQARWL